MIKLNTYVQEFELTNDKNHTIKIIDIDLYIEQHSIGLVGDGLVLYFKREDEKEKILTLLSKISKELLAYSKALKC